MTREEQHEWTVDEVRRQLPEVGVWDGGYLHRGRITGRQLGFAVVRWTISLGGFDLERSAEVGWLTLAYCLTAGRPVIA